MPIPAWLPPQLRYRTSASPPKFPLCPLPVNAHPHSWPQEATVCILSLQIGFVLSRVSYKWNLNISSFESRFLGSACFRDSSMLLYRTKVPSFLLLSGIPLHGQITFCLPVHQQNTWVVLLFGYHELLCCHKYLFMCKSLCEHMLLFLLGK